MHLGATRPHDDEQVLDLLDRALPEVYGYVLHRCRDRAVSEDLTSETFLAAVAAIRADRVSDLTVAWLIGIARHKLADHWRTQARRDRHLAMIAEPAVAVDRLDAAEPGRAMDILATMNPMQRAALVLRHVDGLAVPQVADVLGRSVHATETLLTRARTIFRHRYGADEPTVDDRSEAPS